MTTQLPAERPAPRQQEIFEQVLASGRKPQGRRPWIAPVAAAASITIVAGAVVFAANSVNMRASPDQPSVAGSADGASTTTSRTPTGPADISLNLGPVSSAAKAALAKACVGEKVSVEAITHAIQVKSWSPRDSKDDTVAVLNPQDGLVVACVGTPTRKAKNGQTVEGFTSAVVGGDPSAAASHKAVLNPTDATHPAVPTDGGQFNSNIWFDKSRDMISSEDWYRVDDTVAQVRRRLVVNGKPGPWYVANAVDKLAFVRAWDTSSVLTAGDTVNVQTQVIGRQGQLLDAPAKQLNGGGLAASPGTTRTEAGRVESDGAGAGEVRFDA